MRWVWISGLFLFFAGCVGTAVRPNEIYYGNGVVYYLASSQSDHPSELLGVTYIHLDRDYVTVQTRDGTHIIPRDRFIQSSPTPAAVATTQR